LGSSVTPAEVAGGAYAIVQGSVARVIQPVADALVTKSSTSPYASNANHYPTNVIPQPQNCQML